MSTLTTALLRDRLEIIASINAGNSYIDSVPELGDLNEGYRASADAYDWPELRERTCLIPVANVGRYTIPTNFRKARYVRNQNKLVDEIELDELQFSRRKYAIDKVNSDLILKEIPQTAPTAYTLSNAEAAGNAITIELNSVSGLAQGDEIFIDAATAANEEFTFISSIDTTNTTITCRLKRAKAAGDIIYLVRDCIDLGYRKKITLLSATTDVTLLPDSVDYAMLEYSAYKLYDREEEFGIADKHYERWKRDLAEAWYADGKVSTGSATNFGIKL